MNSTPDGHNDIRQAIGINVKSRDVGTGYIPAKPQQSPTIKSRPNISTGETNMEKLLKQSVVVSSSQQDIKMYLKHNRQYSTISKRYGDSEKLSDLQSHRILKDRPKHHEPNRLSVANMKNQYIGEFVNIPNFPTSQESPETSHRIINENETDNFQGPFSSQQITNQEEQQELTQDHQDSHDRSKDVIIMTLQKEKSATLNIITAKPSKEQLDEVTVINNDGKDTKLEDNKLEDFEQIQPEPIYESNKNLNISPEKMKYPNGIYVKTKKFHSNVLQSVSKDQSNATTYPNHSPISPATGLSHNEHGRISNHFKVSFNKSRKSKGSKVSPNADLGSVQVGVPQSQKNMRQRFVKFQREVKDNFTDVINQMAHINQFGSMDMALSQQKGIVPKRVEFSFENPVPPKEGSFELEQSIETSKSRSRGRNVKNQQGSPSERDTFSPRSTFGSQGFGTTMYNSSYYKKNKLNSQYTNNLQRPQGLTTAPQMIRNAIRRPALSHQKQMNVNRIIPKFQDSKLRVHTKKVIFESKRPTYEQAHGLLIDDKVIKEGMEMLNNQEQKMSDFVMRYAGSDDLMQDSRGTSTVTSPDRDEFKKTPQLPLNKIVLEEDQVRSKLQDDKSSQLLSEWDHRNQNSPNNIANYQQKGIHGIPVLKLYGKKMITTEKSIDAIQDQHKKLKTDESNQNLVLQYDHTQYTEDIRQRDTKFMTLSNTKNSINEMNIMDSTILYKLNVPEVHMTHIGDKLIAGTNYTVKQPNSRETYRQNLQASGNPGQQAVFSRNSISSRKRSMLSILSQQNSSDRDSPQAKKMLKEKANFDLNQIYDKPVVTQKKRLKMKKKSSQFVHEDGLLMVESVGMSMQTSQGHSSQVNLKTQKKHYIPIGKPEPQFKLKKSIDQQQINSFQVEPFPKNSQKYEINVPELSYWKPLSSNKVLKNKKEVKIKIIQGFNNQVKSNVSSIIGLGNNDLQINSRNNEISIPLSRKSSHNKLDPQISQVQFKRMQALQNEFEALFYSCFKPKAPKSSITPTMVTVKSVNKPGAIKKSKEVLNQTSAEFEKKSNSDLFRVNLDVEKIETELQKLNDIEDSVKRLPLKAQPDSVNYSERILDETEIKQISELRLNTFSQDNNRHQVVPVSENLNEHSTCSNPNDNSQSDNPILKNPLYHTDSGGSNHLQFSKSPFLQDEFNPSDLTKEDMANLYQSFELLKRLEAVQGQMPFQNIDARSLLEGGAKDLKIPTDKQLEEIRLKLVEINKQVESLNYNIEVQVQQNATHLARGALTSRKISPAKLAAKIERLAFEPSNIKFNSIKKSPPKKQAPQTVKNSSLTNQRYTFDELKKLNRERLQQSMMRKRKRASNSPIIDKSKIQQIDRTQGINLDQKPKRQALLFRGVLKNIKNATHDDRNADRSTELGQEDKIGLNYLNKKDKMSRFSVSNESDGFQEHLKRTGYSAGINTVSSRNDAVKGNINKDLPSSRNPRVDDMDIVKILQNVEMQQTQDQIRFPGHSEQENSQINFVTGSSHSNSELEKNRSCIVLLEQARQQSKARVARQHKDEKEAFKELGDHLKKHNKSKQISIEDNMKQINTYKQYHEKLESPENEKISSQIIKQAQSQDQYKELKEKNSKNVNKEDLKKIHTQIIQKEIGQCFDRNYMKKLSLSYAEQQKQSLNITHLYSKKYSYRPKLPQLSMSNETIQNSLQISQKLQQNENKLEKLLSHNQSMPQPEVLIKLADKFKHITGSQISIDNVQPSLITNQSLSIEDHFESTVEGNKFIHNNFEINQKDRQLLTKQYSKNHGTRARYTKVNQLQPINPMVPRSKFQLIQPNQQEQPPNKSYCATKKSHIFNQKSITSRAGISTSIPSKYRANVNLPNLNLVLNTDRQKSSGGSRDLGGFLAHNNFASLTMTKNQELIQKYQAPLQSIPFTESVPQQTEFIPYTHTDQSIATIIKQDEQSEAQPMLKLAHPTTQTLHTVRHSKFDVGAESQIEEEPATVIGAAFRSGVDPDVLAQERFESYTTLLR